MLLIAIEQSLNFGFSSVPYEVDLLTWHRDLVFLTSILGFRKEESHTPTLKSALLFNWTGAKIRPFVFCLFVQNSNNKQLGRFMQFYPFRGVLYH